MKKASVKLGAAPVLLCVLFSGCVNLERSYPDKHYFALEANRFAKPSAQTGDGILEVAELRVSPRYDGQSFVYRISEASYETDFYNQFLIAPAALITEEVRQGLTQERIFAYVINSSSQLQPTHRLEGTVNALYGDFRNVEASRAVLEIEFFLSRPNPAGSEIVMNKRYSQSVALSGRSPEALVRGWNQALDAVLGALVADLKAAAPRDHK
jgi:cholesterol transport system auxiliary component